ncbi:MAG TPA: YciI family protein [Polyangia bacterium]
MQYLLMIYVQESGWGTLTPAQQEQGMAAYNAYTEALTKAKVLRAVNRLGPSSSATTIRLKEGKAQVLDGPYADSKEQLGGYYVIEVPSLDEAIAWASRCPGADHGAVEVRPLWT